MTLGGLRRGRLFANILLASNKMLSQGATVAVVYTDVLGGISDAVLFGAILSNARLTSRWTELFC